MIFTLAAAVIATGGILLLSWVARGEADVNGDPERDAGHDIEERGFFLKGTSAPKFRDHRKWMRETMDAAPKNPDGTLKEFSR